MQRHVESLVRRVSPAVVGVRVGLSAGSAVVVTSDGFVLCAAHVCGAPNRDVTFTFPDGRTARGRTLGTNHDMDSGLMKITDEGNWPHVTMADADSIGVGEWVLALGHPGGYDPLRNTVVRLGRIIRPGEMLQTDCTLMAGDSGGPLFDMQGRVVGIHSRISESTSDNFHVPITTYLETWERLVAGENWGGQGPPSVATIGVRGWNDPEGCLLERVNENGAAFRAGLRPGDLVLRVDRERITDADCLVHAIRQKEPGDVIALLVRRDGAEMLLHVSVEARRGRGGRGRPGP
jgi:serine protease Do